MTLKRDAELCVSSMFAMQLDRFDVPRPRRCLRLQGWTPDCMRAGQTIALTARWGSGRTARSWTEGSYVIAMNQTPDWDAQRLQRPRNDTYIDESAEACNVNLTFVPASEHLQACVTVSATACVNIYLFYDMSRFGFRRYNNQKRETRE